MTLAKEAAKEVEEVQEAQEIQEVQEVQEFEDVEEVEIERSISIATEPVSLWRNSDLPNLQAPVGITESDDSDDSDEHIVIEPASLPIVAASKTPLAKTNFTEIAEEIYSMRTNDVTKNMLWVSQVVEKHGEAFAPLLELCPHLNIIFAHMLILRFGARVEDVDWTSDMTDWAGEECERVGRSMATLLRMVQTGEAAVDSWKSQYPQLDKSLRGRRLQRIHGSNSK